MGQAGHGWCIYALTHRRHVLLAVVRVPVAVRCSFLLCSRCGFWRWRLLVAYSQGRVVCCSNAVFEGKSYRSTFDFSSYVVFIILLHSLVVVNKWPYISIRIRYFSATTLLYIGPPTADFSTWVIVIFVMIHWWWWWCIVAVQAGIFRVPRIISTPFSRPLHPYNIVESLSCPENTHFFVPTVHVPNLQYVLRLFPHTLTLVALLSWSCPTEHLVEEQQVLVVWSLQGDGVHQLRRGAENKGKSRGGCHRKPPRKVRRFFHPAGMYIYVQAFFARHTWRICWEDDNLRMSNTYVGVWQHVREGFEGNVLDTWSILVLGGFCRMFVQDLLARAARG